jgi:hypothetical protein
MVSTAWRGRSYPNEEGAEGTGFDPPVFSFPIRSRLTIHTYYDQFVPQVTLATRFFTWMTSLMIATSIVMLISEWEHYWWAPSAVLAGVVAATALTMATYFGIVLGR